MTSTYPPADGRTARRQGLVAAVVAVVGCGVALSDLLGRAESSLVFTAVAVAVVLRWDRPRDLAWIAGAMLPIMVIDGVPKVDLEVLHAVLIGLVALRVRGGLPAPLQRLIWTFGALLGALAVARLAFGLVREAPLPTARYATLTLLTVTVSVLVASRTQAHRPLLIGHLAGTTASSVVAIMQTVGIERIRTDFHGEGRAPGLAFQAPGLSWHIVIALLVGIALIVTSRSSAVRFATGGQMAVCTIALMVCGAQGGLGGLLFAAGVCGFWGREQLARIVRTNRRTAISVCGAIIAVVIAALALGLPSLHGIAGDPDKGYENEVARWRSIEYGIEQLAEHPLTGAGVQEFDARYDVRPHFIPLDASVTTGVIGLLIGCALFGLLAGQLLRRPVPMSPSTMLGLAMLSTMTIHALLTPSGPFSAVERLSVMLIGVVMLRGGSIPFPAAEPAPDDELLADLSQR